MVKLGIIGAMEEEIETLLEQMESKEAADRAGSCFYEGTLAGLDVVVVRCGIGKVNAALCVQMLKDCYNVTHVVNTGIAGSLLAELDIGDLVVSRDAMYHDFDCTHFGYEMGAVPGAPMAFTADDQLVQLALEAAWEELAGHVHTGRIASGDQFIDSQEQKDRIVSVTNAICTEMEGAGIAHAAWRNGLPFVILRAISDKADNSTQMDYPTFERIAAHNCALVTAALARKFKEL